MVREGLGEEDPSVDAAGWVVGTRVSVEEGAVDSRTRADPDKRNTRRIEALCTSSSTFRCFRRSTKQWFLVYTRAYERYLEVILRV